MGNTERFTDHAGHYAKARPSYPEALVDCLYGELGAAPASVFADIGAGTGLFSQLLLSRGSTVYAVEPNGEMAAAARLALGGFAGFHPVDGTAEQTTLPDNSVDFVTCAQSFHWFNRSLCRVEFARILRPGGLCLIIYNRMDGGASAFMGEYERIHFAMDPKRTVDARTLDADALGDFFQPGTLQVRRFPYVHRLDGVGLLARALSSSHAPRPGSEGYDALKTGLERLFAAHARSGVVEFAYQTELFYGKV